MITQETLLRYLVRYGMAQNIPDRTYELAVSFAIDSLRCAGWNDDAIAAVVLEELRADTA